MSNVALNPLPLVVPLFVCVEEGRVRLYGEGNDGEYRVSNQGSASGHRESYSFLSVAFFNMLINTSRGILRTLIVLSLFIFAPAAMLPSLAIAALPSNELWREGLVNNIVGFGKNTTGGKGGALCHVTNLNNSGTGSLRACAEATGEMGLSRRRRTPAGIFAIAFFGDSVLCHIGYAEAVPLAEFTVLRSTVTVDKRKSDADELIVEGGLQSIRPMGRPTCR